MNQKFITMSMKMNKNFISKCFFIWNYFSKIFKSIIYLFQKYQISKIIYIRDYFSLNYNSSGSKKNKIEPSSPGSIVCYKDPHCILNPTPRVSETVI